MSRAILERVGYRMGMDATLVFLVASRMGQLVSMGQEFATINLAISDLYVRPMGHMPLQAYWDGFQPSLVSLLAAVNAVLQKLLNFPVGSLMVTCLLQELQLVVIDLRNCKPWTSSDCITPVALIEVEGLKSITVSYHLLLTFCFAGPRYFDVAADI